MSGRNPSVTVVYVVTTRARSLAVSSRPEGKPRRSWIATATKRLLSRDPTVKNSGTSVFASIAMYQANAVATMSSPTGLSGRRYQA
jgi:hypothetical protein